MLRKDHKGNVNQIHCILHDITDRKKADERLIESETELNVCYENAPLVMLLVDHERRVIKMNAAAVSMAMRSAEKSIGLRGGEALRTCLR
jgi:PAS domain-containing protein